VQRHGSISRMGISRIGRMRLSLISSPSARARPGGDSGGADRATGGDGGAVSWHGSARATSSSFSVANLCLLFTTYVSASSFF
jgi:hypothetical protein